jgi:hypothetical protein
MLRFLISVGLVVISIAPKSFAASESELKKTQLEDIFIWKMSDELKLTTQQEKSFTELSRSLNRKKTELNRQIQETVQNLGSKNQEADLQKYRRLIAEYSQLSVKEFDSIKRLLGSEKFSEYLKIKYELTTTVKSMLVGEKPSEKKEPVVNLPPPKVIVEK